MGKGIRYSDEFKRDAVAQVKERGYSIKDVSERLGICTKPSIVASNQLGQKFDVALPDQVWVTDITYIRTHEGWLYLAVVIDLYSRRVVGCSMNERMQTSLALNALLMAIWRRKPKAKVIVHSDQGSQFTSQEWQSFLSGHNLKASMSRRGNCYE